jgi:hypothetical protein
MRFIMKSISKWLVELWKSTDIKVLVFSFSILPLLFLAGAAYFADKLFGGDVPERFTATVMAVAAFLASLAGCVQIARKESPGIMDHNFRGKIAVWTGSLWVAFCWLLGLLILYFGFSVK